MMLCRCSRSLLTLKPLCRWQLLVSRQCVCRFRLAEKMARHNNKRRHILFKDKSVRCIWLGRALPCHCPFDHSSLPLTMSCEFFVESLVDAFHAYLRTDPSPPNPTESTINNSKTDIYACIVSLSLGRSRQTCNLRQVPACVRLHRNGNSCTQHFNTKMSFLTVNLFRLFFFFSISRRCNFRMIIVVPHRNLHGKEYIYNVFETGESNMVFCPFSVSSNNVSDEWRTCL